MKRNIYDTISHQVESTFTSVRVSERRSIFRYLQTYRSTVCLTRTQRIFSRRKFYERNIYPQKYSQSTIFSTSKKTFIKYRPKISRIMLFLPPNLSYYSFTNTLYTRNLTSVPYPLSPNIFPSHGASAARPTDHVHDKTLKVT